MSKYHVSNIKKYHVNDNRQEYPYVFILDIDGTMIGDISPQIMLYELCLGLRDKHFKMNIKAFENKLSNGLIRPYFDIFLKKMTETFHNKCEFFIYTSAERQWTLFLIPHIERILKIKFNRPLFTRDNCQLINGDYKKSLNSILPKISIVLQKKYGKLDKSILKEKLLIIDNNSSVYEEVDQKHLISCPTYDYKIPENIPLYISNSIFNLYQQQIIKILSRNIPQIVIANNYNKFQIEFYKFYVIFLQTIQKNNDLFIKDNYFNYLSNVITYKGITKFTYKTVLYLQLKMGKRFRNII